MDNVNPLKQNARVQQFLGWFVAILFPFTLKGIIEITDTLIIAALVYWGICGLLLRYAIDQRFPYLHPQASKIKNEIVILIFVTVFCGYLYIKEGSKLFIPIDKDVFRAILFAIFNGSFEHLVWINIFDLAGCKKTFSGFIAASIYIVLIYSIFWKKIVPVTPGNIALFIFLQVIRILVLFFMYIKTRDITIWSIQNIIYNLFAVFMGSVDIFSFLHIFLL